MRRLVRHRHAAWLRQGGCCYYCDRATWEEVAETFAGGQGLTKRQIRLLRSTAEHLIARQDGGTDAAANIVSACWFCNSRRHRTRRPLDAARYRLRVQRGLTKPQGSSVQTLAGGDVQSVVSTSGLKAGRRST